MKTILQREVGVWGLSFNMINIMIGAGIFVLPAIIAEGLGPASIFAYLICGVLISLVMLCFAEVGSVITDDGGVYAYLDRTLGDYFGFKAATLFLLGAMSADAAIANAIADIASSLIGVEFSKAIRALFFFLIFGGLALINIRGARSGLLLVKTITIAKLAPLVLLILFASGEINFANLAIHDMPSIKEFGQVSLILFFAFMGSESGLSISGEVKNPQKIIPRAIFLAISIALVLYMLIQGATLGVLGPSLSEFKENPLGEVAHQLIGPVGLTLMIIGAGVSMFGNLSSEILSLPRILFGASKDRVIPVNILSRIHPKFATPYVAIIAIAGIDFLLATFGGFEQLAIFATATILLVYFGMAIAVIKLRKINPEKPEGSFRIPGGYTVPVLTAVVIIWFLSNLTKNEILGIVAVIAFLSLIYFIFVKRMKAKNPPS
ncbi:MAG: amino acid permease [Bacteroides sp.]|nr:amino acid permease [Bacteroides sp.]